jgi:uncharacterized protein (DUF1800 family)
MVPDYERQAVRPHALGRFRDLVVATAAAPRHALLPRQLAEHARRLRPAPSRGGRKLGLNENYARELMELHTLAWTAAIRSRT